MPSPRSDTSLRAQRGVWQIHPFPFQIETLVQYGPSGETD
jgi:hypothetical protein